jgi:hypothetical protein
MGSFTPPKRFYDPLDLEMLEWVLDSAWTALQARAPSRDPEKGRGAENGSPPKAVRVGLRRHGRPRHAAEPARCEHGPGLLRRLGPDTNSILSKD